MIQVLIWIVRRSVPCIALSASQFVKNDQDILGSICPWVEGKEFSVALLGSQFSPEIVVVLLRLKPIKLEKNCRWLSHILYSISPVWVL